MITMIELPHDDDDGENVSANRAGPVGRCGWPVCFLPVVLCACVSCLCFCLGRKACLWRGGAHRTCSGRAATDVAASRGSGRRRRRGWSRMPLYNLRYRANSNFKIFLQNSQRFALKFAKHRDFPGPALSTLHNPGSNPGLSTPPGLQITPSPPRPLRRPFRGVPCKWTKNCLAPPT